MPAEQQNPTNLLRYTAVPFRRAIFLAIAVGGAGLLATAVLGRPLLGVFGCIGLALGAVNGHLMQRSLSRFSVDGKPADKKRVALSSLSRLAMITAAAVVFAVVVRPDGSAVFLGVAVFQLVMMINAGIPVLKELRK